MIQPLVCITCNTVTQTVHWLYHRLHVIQPVCLCYMWNIPLYVCVTRVTQTVHWLYHRLHVTQTVYICVTGDTTSVCLCNTWYIHWLYVCVTGYTWYNQCMFVLHVIHTTVCLCYTWYNQYVCVTRETYHCMFVSHVTRDTYHCMFVLSRDTTSVCLCYRCNTNSTLVVSHVTQTVHCLCYRLHV